MRVLTLLLVAFTLGSVQEERAHAIALVGGTVVDVSAFGTSTVDIPDAAVIVENGRIAGVGPRRSTMIPRGAEVIDVSGKCIVPGSSDVFGTINNADLLVVDADPTVDVANLKRISRLMLAGTRIDRGALLHAGK